MKRIRKYLAVLMAVCLMGGFMFFKSMDFVRNNNVIALLLENIEALTSPEGIDYYNRARTGTCGVKVIDYKDTPYEYWTITCYISYSEVMFKIQNRPIGTYNWCCDNCASSTYCDGRYD